MVFLRMEGQISRISPILKGPLFLGFNLPRLDKLLNMNNDAFNLQEPVGFEVISTDGEWVEFKIKCCLTDFRSCTKQYLLIHIFFPGWSRGSGKTLEEKSRFIKDRTQIPTFAGMVFALVARFSKLAGFVDGVFFNANVGHSPHGRKYGWVYGGETEYSQWV